MELEGLRRIGKDVKLVVFDLDGTLLTSQNTISYHSVLAIKELEKKGCKIAIASGRIFTMLKSYYESLELNDFVISANGASIDDIGEQKIIQQLFVDPDDSKKVVEFCVNNHIECNILKREACYFPADSIRLEKFMKYNTYADAQNSTPIEIKIYDQGIDGYRNIEKLLVYETNSIKIKKIKRFVDQYTNLIYTSSGVGILDVSAQGVSKGQAVIKIAQYLNLDMKQVCVFGDYDNDISMFEVSGISIATGNASKLAQKYADFITLSNDDEGIAYAVRELLL